MSTLAAVAAAAGAGAVVAAARAVPPTSSALHGALAEQPPSPVEALGHAVARRTRLPSDGSAARAVGRLLLLAAAVALVAPLAGGALVAAGWLWAWTAPRRARRATTAAVRQGLPDAVDLLVLCTTSGLSLPLAHAAVAARLGGPLGAALRSADIAVAQGASRADALVSHLGPLGDRAAGLAHVLTDHLRYGVPLAPSLERLALELRLDRRRHAEQAARQVPVRLLAPLVLCTLPAFALLTVVPLLGASATGLSL